MKTKKRFPGAGRCWLYLLDQMCGPVLLGLLGSVLLICPASGVNDNWVLTPEEVYLKLSESPSSLGRTENGSTTTGISVMTFKWDHVETPFVVVSWILVAGLAKLGR